MLSRLRVKAAMLQAEHPTAGRGILRCRPTTPTQPNLWLGAAPSLPGHSALHLLSILSQKVYKNAGAHMKWSMRAQRGERQGLDAMASRLRRPRERRCECSVNVRMR